jgi:hypothetical protein
MENLHIKGSKGIYFIPTVDFDVATGECSLFGESFLEDTDKFYNPLNEWVRKFIREVKKPIAFHIGLTYYNTSSSRAILTFLKILRDYKLKGGKVDVTWQLSGDNEMLEEIEDFKIESELDIKLVPPEKQGF